MTERGRNSIGVKALTKRKKQTDELYSRRAEVESQIAEASRFDERQINERLKNRQRESSGYLLDETIVYLLRERVNDRVFVETVYVELNRRILRLLKKFYQRFRNAADFEDFAQKVEMAIVKRIFDVDSDAADYAQINFGDFVVKTAKVAWRGELVKIEREQEIFYHERENGEDDAGNLLENSFRSADAPADYSMTLREGLNKLPAHLMTVAELLLDGWQIESKDELEPTISGKLGVSSRTIRNWLKEARGILDDYNREVRR